MYDAYLLTTGYDWDGLQGTKCNQSRGQPERQLCHYSVVVNAAYSGVLEVVQRRSIVFVPAIHVSGGSKILGDDSGSIPGTMRVLYNYLRLRTYRQRRRGRDFTAKDPSLQIRYRIR